MQQYFDRKKHPRGAWVGIVLVGHCARPAAVRAGRDRHRVGAHHESRDPVRAAVARPQHRRRLRRTARSRLHRVLRGRRLRLRAPRVAALRSAPSVLDHPSDRRRRRLPVRRAARRADAQASRRLSRDRHAGLRRDHPDLPQQPVAAGEPHQRAAGNHADRPVPDRQLQLRDARDDRRARFHRARSSTTTSWCCSSSSSSSSICGCRIRGSAARGRRSARTRSPPARWASTRGT